jgi:tetratricopeptide (TPR) repeat protein
MPEKPKIFLSHSWDNKPLVQRLEQELQAAGAEVWVDHAGVRAGDNLPEKVSQALEWCDTFVLVWSETAAKSRWVTAEWTSAFSRGKLIIPCCLDQTALPALLANLLYVDFSNVEQGVARLREAVQRAQKPVSDTPTTDTERLARFLRFQWAGDLPAIWNVPHHRNPNFTGRGQELADLRAALTKERTAALTQTQAIHGLGGVGKTQLALEYAYRFAADYQLVWWLRAEEPATLAADYAGLATPLNLPEKEAKDQSAIIHAVRQWLDHHSGWLLIFDNAQQPEALLEYLPQAPTGHVIITSRHPHWKNVANPLRVQVWPREESVAFLLRRTGAPDKPAAAAIAEELGDLPLALEQAGAYIEATGISLAEYLNLFRQYRRDLLQQYGPLELGYPHTVATTWEMAFEKVKAETPVAADLLKACAFLAPDNIPRPLLIEGRQNLPQALTKALALPLEVNKAVASLVRYSLIEASSETLSLHRLVQAVTRDRMPEEEKQTWAAAVVKLMAQAFPEGTNPTDVRFWPACASLLPHALTAAEHAEEHEAELKDVALLFNQVGIYLYARAQYAAAEPLYRRALEIREKQLGPNHPAVATSLNNLAGLLDAQGNYAAAEPLYRRALKIDEKQLGPDHPHVATSLNNLALLLHAQGNYAAAEPLYRRSLKIREQQLGPDHPDVAQSLNNLAGLLRDQGNYAAAEPLSRRALEIFEKQLGPDHPDVAQSLNNLALLLQAQGNYAAAEPLFRRALEIREKHLGPNHPAVATSLNNLAGLLDAQGNYAAAEPLYRRSLKIREQQLGPDHPDIAQSLNNLALLLQAQGNYAAAEPLYRRALEIREKHLGPNHPAVATSLNNLAGLLRVQGNYAAAEPLYRRALEIREKQLGPNHPAVATSLNNLAGLLRVQGNYAAAEPLYRRALEILEKSLGAEHPHTQTVRENLARLRENK